MYFADAVEKRQAIKAYIAKPQTSHTNQQRYYFQEKNVYWLGYRYDPDFRVVLELWSVDLVDGRRIGVDVFGKSLRDSRHTD